MKREQALAKNTAILMFGKICTQCISFFLLPLYTNILTTSEYGIYDLMITYSTLLLPIVNWQFDQGMFRFVLEKRNNKEEISEIFSTIFISSIAQSLIYILILLIVDKYHPIDNKKFLMTYVALHVFVGLFLQFSRGVGKSGTYAVASFISAITTVILNIITLVSLQMGLRGLFVSSILSQIVTILYLTVVNRLWQYLKIKKINSRIYKQVCQYSLPLIPNNLAWWVVNASDRLVINHFIGIAQNGIYTVACKFPNVFINLYNIVNLSWTESASLHYNDEDRDKFFSEMMTAFFKMFSACCYIIISVMPFVFPLLVNEKFALSYNHIYILMMAMLFRVMVGLYSCIYIAQKKSKSVAYTSITAAIINLSVDLLLIKKIHLYAASISTLVAFAVMFIVRYVDVNKHIKVRIESKVLTSTILLGILLGPVYYSRNYIIQIVFVGIVFAFSIITNKTLIKSGSLYLKDLLYKHK